MMFPQSRHSASSQQLKFTTSDSCDRIKDEFQFLQAQYHSLKLECDKLASEKSEMQRHYIMQQLQAHQLSQLQGLALPMTPLPLGLSQPAGLPAVTSSSGLFSLSSILASQAQLAKEDKSARDASDSHREEDGDKSD
ncbi:hypothetical protein SRHO_G00167570 [Serrasalmus rhombeus]